MFKLRYVINLTPVNIHNSLVCAVYNWNIILVYGNSRGFLKYVVGRIKFSVVCSLYGYSVVTF